MHSTEPSPDISGSLEAIARHGVTVLSDRPIQFVLALARAWKERGGIVAGKPRHSDRYLDDLLRSRGTPVRSLTPKLAGRTNLRPTDAEILVRVFLSHWDYIGDPWTTDIVGRVADFYRPMLAADQIERVTHFIADRIAEAGPEPKSEAESPVPSLSGQDMVESITTQFRQSAAMFAIGPGQTLLVPKPELALIGFRNLMNTLWEIDRSDDRQRILIWILDLGRQDFEDPEARARFLNVEAVISRFKALRLFKERDAKARWAWLHSRTVIVLHDTRHVRPTMPWLPAFDPNHVLFSAVPPRWVLLPEFRALYGTEFDRLREAVYAIFLGRPSEDVSDSATSLSEVRAHSPAPYQFRYFGYALLRSDETGERTARGLELTTPGRSYVEALGTVFAAAGRMLELPSAPTDLSIEGMNIDQTHAIESLNHHGFRLLRLDEFVGRS